MESLVALVLAATLTACGAGSKDEASQRAPETAAADPMAAELDALPDSVVVRVPLDASGRELDDQATLATARGDDQAAAERAFGGGGLQVGGTLFSGQAVAASDWEIAFDAADESDETLDALATLGGYRASRWYGYRPGLGSRIVAGAVWVFTRPIAWTVGGYRYYRYKRPVDCGCYRPKGHGGYVVVKPQPGKGYGPGQQPGYVPGYGPGQQPGYAPPAKGPGQQPGYVPSYGPGQQPGYVPPVKGK